MSLDTPDRVRARAIEWHIRLRDGDDATWEAFAEWIAADPRHASAYDQVEAADHALDPLLPEVVVREAANDMDETEQGDEGGYAPPPRRWRRGLAGGAIAASIAAVLLLVQGSDSSRYQVTTAPGERQVITLDASTRVTLNGGTRMTFDRKDPRYASLASGEAYFQVRHDAANPFRVEVGGNIVEDAGTIFNVVREDDEVRVAVAEGKVVYNPGSRAVALDAGQALVDRRGATRVSRVPAAVVGSWKTGTLVYDAAPLARVAADLSRVLDEPVASAPSVAGRPFTGTITLDGSGSAHFARLGAALGVAIEKREGRWIMGPAGSARP